MSKSFKIVTYHITLTYEVELEAKDREEALELAERSLDESMTGEGYNCFELEVKEVKG